MAGIFAFAPVQQATTVHQSIIDAINAGNDALAIELLDTLEGDHGDITDELKDKLKLLNATDTQTITMGDTSVPGFQFDGFTITVNATNADNELVIFNLKEIYICGDGSNQGFDIQAIGIENAVLDSELLDLDDADIIIQTFEIPLFVGVENCVDVITRIAMGGPHLDHFTGEPVPAFAGQMGLGSDGNLIISVQGGQSNTSDFVDFVKCIAFVPNEAVTLVCDIEPTLTFEIV